MKLFYSTTLLLSSITLVACGGSSSNESSGGGVPSALDYSIGGSISGLSGTGLQLTNNSDVLSITGNDSFTFSSRLKENDAYAISVSSQPTSPNQTCSVINSSGTIATSDITNISIACVMEQYAIGGNVSGLNAGAVTLQNNAGDDVVIGNGAFTFPTTINDASAYTVTVSQQPSGQLCSVSNGNGSLAGSAVNNVSVSCVTAYSIGGTITGLTGSGLILQNNASDDLTVSSGSNSFEFATSVLDGDSYAVTVKKDPTGPKQTCSVSNASGPVASANVTSVSINCVAAVKNSLATFHDPYLGKERALGLELADINGDNKIDLLLAHGTDAPLPNSIWLNDGTGQDEFFGLTETSMFGNADTRDVVAADLDGDGDLDLIESNNGANKIFINQGGTQGGTEGDFVDSGQSLGTGNTYEVVVADVDGDTDLDFLAVNQWTDINRVWINGGVNTATFTSSYSFGVLQEYSYGAQFGDFDNDGDMDFVSVNNSTIGTVLHINQGGVQGGTEGDFAEGATILASLEVRAVEIADVDNDNDLDLILGRWAANRVFLNNGSGVFTDSGQLLGSRDTTSMAVADFDNDGDVDFVAQNDYGAGNKHWVNQGGAQGGTLGVFQDSGQRFGTREIIHEIESADVDSDGDIDLVEAYYQGAVIWLNIGNGSFEDPLQHLYDGLRHIYDSFDLRTAMTVADLTNDGVPDILDAAGWGADSMDNMLWVSNGDGTFPDRANRLTNVTVIRTDTINMLTGQLDRNIGLDIVDVNNVHESEVLLNDGTGQFNRQQKLDFTGNNGVLADVDNDNDLDIVLARGVANTIWLNDGNANFTDSGQALGSTNSYAVAAGDIDSDGDVDLVFAEYADQDTVWINQGGGQGGTLGQFLMSSQLASTHLSSDVKLADLDGDGDLDAVFGYNVAHVYPNKGDTIWWNDGTGNFSDSGIKLALDSESTSDILLEDMDDDGDIDIYVAKRIYASVLWLNQGGDQLGVEGNFVQSPNTIGTSTLAADIADVDLDGDLDIFEMGESTPIKIYLNETYK